MPRLTPSDLTQRRWQNTSSKDRSAQMRRVRLSSSARTEDEKRLLQIIRELRAKRPRASLAFVLANAQMLLNNEKGKGK